MLRCGYMFNLIWIYVNILMCLVKLNIAHKPISKLKNYLSVIGRRKCDHLCTRINGPIPVWWSLAWKKIDFLTKIYFSSLKRVFDEVECLNYFFVMCLGYRQYIVASIFLSMVGDDDKSWFLLLNLFYCFSWST